MRSATAISHELDDVKKAADELAAQIRGKLTPFGKHTAAILHGQPDMEIGELSAAISRELGCHVIGGTTAGGAVLTNDGYHELAVVLHAMSGDDCLFAAAISGPMEGAPKKEIRSTYQKAYGELKGQDPTAEPKLVICIASLMQSCSSDIVLSELSDACGSLPIFGYASADDFDFYKQQVFLDGESAGDRLALLLVAGNVDPVFQVANLMGKQTLEKRLVTKAQGNIINEIDGKPAYDYIRDFPFIDDETKILYNFQFFVEMKNTADDDGFPVSRALNTYSKDTGAVTCFADVPQGSCIGLRFCDGNDVAVTSEAGLRELNSKLEAAGGGRRFSTALIATCSLRNMFLAGSKDTEGNLIKELLPPSISASGLYAFGEIAPTSMSGGKAVNRFHNATFTVCAF